MTREKVHVKLYGSKADRFESIKEALTEELGYEPTNPEVIGYLMGAYSVADDAPWSDGDD